ncbi:hypothetical protein JOD24_003188 [Kroppenstedtia sanguinis]|uniref:colicin E3/pyocin S6 family cytotoxin n=1 Tax=Kroppenstedtia sanguinis TaxID=1380684 RepID=UPI003D235FA7
MSSLIRHVLNKRGNVAGHKILKEETNFMKSKGMKRINGNKRKTWEDKDGYWYQWDSQHGALEVWDPKQKNHLKEIDPVTGKKTKNGEKGRKFDR